VSDLIKRLRALAKKCQVGVPKYGDHYTELYSLLAENYAGMCLAVDALRNGGASAMRDDEILMRLAEIEGLAWNRNTSRSLAKATGAWRLWNPLTNDAQAMALMKKYKVGVVNFESPTLIYPLVTDRDHGWGAYCGTGGSVYNDNLNRAICMAIVEAHSG
jgi:hypothetical protein